METIVLGRRNFGLSQEGTQGISLHTANSSGCGAMLHRTTEIHGARLGSAL